MPLATYMIHGPTKHHQFKSFNIKVNLKNNKPTTERPNNLLRETFPKFKVYVRCGRIWIHGQQEAYYYYYYLVRTKEIKLRVRRIWWTLETILTNHTELQRWHLKDRFVTCFTYYYMRPLNGSFEILRLQHCLRNMFYISAVHTHIFFVLKQALRNKYTCGGGTRL